MSETLKTLSNIRSLRAIAREASLAQLEILLDKVTIVVEEKREAARAIEAEKAKQLESLNKYKEMLDRDGISAEELALLLGNSSADVKKQREPRTPRPAKYKYVDELGNEKTWTGQGRTPRAIQQALDAGKSLSEFAI